MSFLDRFSCEEQKQIQDAQKLLLAKRKIIAEWEQEHGEAIGAEYEEYYYKRLKEMGF